MSEQSSQAKAFAAPAPTNGIGLAGMILSIVGIFCCGLLHPLSLLISLIGLFKAPRGMAIAGSIISALGSIWMVAFGFAMVMGILGLGEVIDQGVMMLNTTIQASEAADDIQAEYSKNDELPDESTGQKLIDKYEDAYGNKFQYRPIDETNFEVRSAGSDGKFDTSDDIEMTRSVFSTGPSVPEGTGPSIPEGQMPDDQNPDG